MEAGQPPTLVIPIDISKSFITCVSPRIGKSVKDTIPTSVRDHLLACDHKVVYKDLKFLGNKSW